MLTISCYVVISPPGKTIDEPWMVKLVQHKCEKMYIEYMKHKSSIINFHEIEIFEELSILEPIMIIIQYLKNNYLYILAESILYIRTLILIYIREDSMTISRKSKNSLAMCGGCLNDVCGADLLDRKRTKLKLNLKRLSAAYAQMQNQTAYHKLVAYHNLNYDTAVSCMHECKIHCFIVRGSMESISGKEGKFGRDMQVIFDNWKDLYNACVIYVDHLDSAYSQVLAINAGTLEEDDHEKEVENTTESGETSKSINFASVEYDEDDKVFDL